MGIAGEAWIVVQLKALGITDLQIDLMTRRNQAILLGLDPQPLKG